VIEGTADVDADRVPAPVWKFAWECWHKVESRDDPDLTPRESCPKCGGEVVSFDPLEEHCLNPCDYYRAEGNGGVIRE
jgi:rRNA maturation protein Nop10